MHEAATPDPPPAAAATGLLPCPTGDLAIPAAPRYGLGPPLRLSLVIPTYNESRNLPELVARLTSLLDRPLGGSYELIVVDDDSPDRTWEVALELAKAHPQLRVVRRQGERGLSTAVIRGWQAARGEVLAVMDADLQHPPEVNLGLWREIERGADLAAASRHVEGGGVSDWSLLRRALSRGAQLLGLLILPGVLSRLSDPMSGYFMVRRSALAGVTLDPLGYKILIEVVGRGAVRWIGEVPYVFRERTQGESKVTWRLYLDYLGHLVKLRRATFHRSRFYRFGLVGLSGVAVDMGLFYLLSDPRALGLGLTRSKLVSAEAALVGNFLFNEAWTYADLAGRAPGLRSKLRRLLGYNAVCGVGLCISVLLLNLLFNLGHLDRYLANAVAIGAAAGWNYWFVRQLNYRG
jgi:dolichol-phosphate mannosyltransferase